MTQRREFIKQLSALGLLSTVPEALLANKNSLAPFVSDQPKLWGSLLHLSFNMWEEYSSPNSPLAYIRARGYQPYLQVDQSMWDSAIKQMAEAGMNMVLIDLGDAVYYKSHPEIAVKNAWKSGKLKDELDKIRALGLEPIPKLNFSAGHDTWLGTYHRMVSTEKYYEVCKSLIAEVIDIFDKPRFFHLGMDEETAEHQKFYNYVVVRQNDLWWHDLYFLLEQVEKKGVRPWIWSDYIWNHPETFLEKMPKTVLQSNWYYREKFDEKHTYVKAYLDLEAHGYDQIPCASNYYETDPGSMMNTVKFCSERIADKRLLGFMQSYWVPTTEPNRQALTKGIALVKEAKEWYLKNAGPSH